MSNSSIEELKRYCLENNIPEPKCETIYESNCCKSTITVGVVEEKGIENTELEAMNWAAMMVLSKLKNKSFAQLKEENVSINDNQINCNNNDNTNSVINPVLNTSPTTAQNGNSEIINYTGILQELMQKKGSALPKYEEPIKSGEDHCPKFSIKCKVIFNGCEMSGDGEGRTVKDAKKASSECVYRQILNYQSNNGSKIAEDNQILFRYFSKNFSQLSLNLCFEDNEKDYYKKLEKIAPIIGCNINCMVSIDGKKVTLQLTINHMKQNQILLTSYGSSDEGLKESKRLAAKKAVRMLEVLNTRD